MAKYLAAVRYGLMSHVENFQSNAEGLAPGQMVIIRTNRGVEWGETTSPPQLIEREVKGLGEILRPASEDDEGIMRHIREVKEPEELEYCRSMIRDKKLPMKLIGIEHLFSGDKIVYYFLADGRVDFRELVKELARRYRTRIEMRQIGVRDEARLLADYEHCGRELCCRTFLRNLEPVTMRMAKTQKTTLDPSKISGHCGRLMCCLRFEDAVYTELRRELPKRGKTAVTPQMRGEVVASDILKQEVTLRLGDGSRETVHVSEITEVLHRTPQNNDRRADNRPKRDSRGSSRNHENKAPSDNAGQDNGGSTENRNESDSAS